MLKGIDEYKTLTFPKDEIKWDHFNPLTSSFRMEPTMVEILKSRHHFLDLIQVAFVLTDGHSKILYANRYTERLFGYTGEEVKGQRIRIFFLNEDLTYFLPNIIYLTLYQNGFEGEALLKQRDGKKIFVHLSTNSFKEEGEVFLTFSFQEIQRLKKLEREKLEMEHWASLGIMVEEIAHQVRNPIVSIGGYTQRLMKSIPSSSKNRSYLDQILRETKRLETMIQRVEEVVLIPRLVFKKEKVQEVAEAALQTISEKATEQGISLNLETEALKGDEYFFVDKDLVVRAIDCILQNSIEAVSRITIGRKGTTVKMALFKDEDNIGISISDKGEGIAKKNIDHIFEPFFSTRPDRVGMELTFAKRVVEEHGGTIQVESRLKKGTTITLTFPKDRRRKVRRELISPGTDILSSTPL
jgi:PAS domain S-box-containing protein